MIYPASLWVWDFFHIWHFTTHRSISRPMFREAASKKCKPGGRPWNMHRYQQSRVLSDCCPVGFTLVTDSHLFAWATATRENWEALRPDVLSHINDHRTQGEDIAQTWASVTLCPTRILNEPQSDKHGLCLQEEWRQLPFPAAWRVKG